MWENKMDRQHEHLSPEKIEGIRKMIAEACHIIKEDPATHPPGFMFRVKQWLGDNNVMLMDWDARGMHMHFMCISWQQNPPGTLPNDDQKLRRWAYNHAEWERLKPQIFNPDPTQSPWKLIDALWVQEALIKEFIRQSQYRLTRQRAAKKRWQPSMSDAYASTHGVQKSYSDVPGSHPSVYVQRLETTPSPSEKEMLAAGDPPSTLSEAKPVGSLSSSNAKPHGAHTDLATPTHPRLAIFCEEYQSLRGFTYVVGNYREEGGAAKHTATKIPSDALYRLAVQAYLTSQDARLKENGYPFLWFIRELNRWVTKGNSTVDESQYNDICE